MLQQYVGESFSVGRGVRQGCPLSSLLFCWTFDAILRWVANSAPIPIHLTAYCDDVSLLLSQIHGIGARFLGVICEVLSHVAHLFVNHRKVNIVPLARSLCGRCLDFLAECDDAWRQSHETLSARLLGYRVGPEAPGDEWGDVVTRVMERTCIVGSMHLGAPASLKLALSVVWTVAYSLSWRTLSQ